MESGPAVVAVPGAVLRGLGCGALVQLPARQYSDSAPAVEVGHAWHDCGDSALHPALHRADVIRLCAETMDAGVRAVAGPASTHIWIRHLPLPVDGRRPDLQTRHGVHARRGRRRD